ncbi:hypothetical protein ACIQI7_23650 [Kitasatospora sp. NPDC092039]|uniref:hypothetical protein n=1 Tax=Kitasatospora sp. NPDC092039 TaxID=3364086 RepID=UPI00380C16FF
MTIPPPPNEPPTIGMSEPVVEWWRKGGPWNPPRVATGSAPRQFTAEPVYVDLRTTDSAGAVEGQAVGDDDLEQADPAEAAADEQVRRGEDHAEEPRTAFRNLRDMISMTPEEHAEQARLRREAALREVEAEETPEEREDRLRTEQAHLHAQQVTSERRASRLWRQPHSERARRFRRWCILTAASGIAGYQMGLVHLAAHVPLTVATIGAGLGWLLDLRMRGWGHVRVSEVRGPVGIAVLILVRVPFASALVGTLGLAPLITLFSTIHH